MSDERAAGDVGFNQLHELDQGFRSLRLEEKLQSVLKYIPFFNAHRSPSLVTAGFLKLADYWKTSNNVVRQYIFKVVKHSQHALLALASAEEILRRISVVLTSNDLVARALTLRLLGYMSVVVSANTEVHHSVRLLLDSKEPMELEAALFAADRIAFRSEPFCSNHIAKLHAIMEDSEADSVAKDKVIKVNRHMYHTPQLATKARQSCIFYLTQTHSESEVLNVLHTLTVLACRCVFQIPDQIDLLLDRAETAPCQSIQFGALRDLVLLGKTQAHHFHQTHFAKVLNIALESTCDEVQLKGFTLLHLLAGRLASTAVQDFESTPAFKSLYSLILRGGRVSFGAAKVLCLLRQAQLRPIRATSSAVMEVDEPEAALLQGLLESISTVSFSRNPTQFRYLVGTIARISTLSSTALWPELLNKTASDPKGVNIAFNIALNSIASPTARPAIAYDLVINLAIAHAAGLQVSSMKRAIEVTLQNSETKSPEVKKHIQELLGIMRSRKTPAWHFYKVGIEALCSGWPEIGQAELHNIDNKVTTDATRFWLTALQNIADAFVALRIAAESKTAIVGDPLPPVATKLWTALTAMEALAATASPRHFQILFLTLYARIISSTSLILQKLHLLQRMSIPLSSSNRAQWSNFVKDFEEFARECEELGHQCEDADCKSTDTLQMFCMCIAEMVRSLAVPASGIEERMSASASHIIMYAPKDSRDDLLCLVRQKSAVREATPQTLRLSILLALGKTVSLPRAFFTSPQRSNIAA